MPCYSPLKGFRDEETGGIVFKGQGHTDEMEVACGQCLGCRLDRARMWTARISHEASLHEYQSGNCFLTLTYRSVEECTARQLAEGQHVPENWSLNKRHFQLFMKRLRKRFPDQRIRFFMCGEYGQVCRHNLNLTDSPHESCPRGRPHYHAILFGFVPPDLELVAEDEHCRYYASDIIESVWGYGHIQLGELTPDSAAYVARYNLKKITGFQAETEYLAITDDGEEVHLQPEFNSMSRRPGIASEWYELYKGDLFPSDETPIVGSGVFHGVPRYYCERFKEEDPLGYEELQEVRQAFRDAHIADYSPARLMDKYKVAKANLALREDRKL